MPNFFSNPFRAGAALLITSLLFIGCGAKIMEMRITKRAVFIIESPQKIVRVSTLNMINALKDKNGECHLLVKAGLNEQPTETEFGDILWGNYLFEGNGYFVNLVIKCLNERFLTKEEEASLLQKNNYDKKATIPTGFFSPDGNWDDISRLNSDGGWPYNSNEFKYEWSRGRGEGKKTYRAYVQPKDVISHQNFQPAIANLIALDKTKKQLIVDLYSACENEDLIEYKLPNLATAPALKNNSKGTLYDRSGGMGAAYAALGTNTYEYIKPAYQSQRYMYVLKIMGEIGLSRGGNLKKIPSNVNLTEWLAGSSACITIKKLTYTTQGWPLLSTLRRIDKEYRLPALTPALQEKADHYLPWLAFMYGWAELDAASPREVVAAKKVVTAIQNSEVLIAAGTLEFRNRLGERNIATLTNSYFMTSTEVTQGQYKAVMGTNPSEFRSCGRNCPVENISWRHAIVFANRLSDAAGLERCYEGSGSGIRWSKGYKCNGYRLPTETEWINGSQGGEINKFSGSNTADEVAWYARNSGKRTHRVGQKAPNGYGLYDMTGNVSEFCWDVRRSDFPLGTDSHGPGGLGGSGGHSAYLGSRGEEIRVTRGGNVYSEDHHGLLKPFRKGEAETSRSTGFRLVRTSIGPIDP